MPPGASVDVAALIRQHRRWILARHRERRAIEAMTPHVEWGGWVWVLGERVSVDQIGLSAPGAPAPLREQLEQWYRHRAAQHMSVRVAFWSCRLDIPYSEFFLSNAATRWGYCTPYGRIALSWRLYQAPGWVLDYVAVHELMHRRFPHHRSSFWTACQTSYSQTADARAWLREFGHALIW